MSIHVTIWNEYRHERESDIVAAVYPDGIHTAIAVGPAGRTRISSFAPQRSTSRNTA